MASPTYTSYDDPRTAPSDPRIDAAFRVSAILGVPVCMIHECYGRFGVLGFTQYGSSQRGEWGA